MGDILSIKCESCAVERVDYVGCGMAGACSELLGCTSCRKFVLYTVEVFGPAVDQPRRECPDCRAPLSEVLTDERDHKMVSYDFDGEFSGTSIGECPICNGHLHGGSIGIWD